MPLWPLLVSDTWALEEGRRLARPLLKGAWGQQARAHRTPRAVGRGAARYLGTLSPLPRREQSGSVGPDGVARAGHRAPGGGEGGGGVGKVRQAARRPRGSEVWGAELRGGPEGL